MYGIDEKAIMEAREERSKAANSMGLGLSEEEMSEMKTEKAQLQVVRSKVMDGVTIIEREPGDWVVAMYTRVLSETGFKSPKKAEKWLKKMGIRLIPIVAMAVACTVNDFRTMAEANNN